MRRTEGRCWTSLEGGNRGARGAAGRRYGDCRLALVLAMRPRAAHKRATAMWWPMMARQFLIGMISESGLPEDGVDQARVRRADLRRADQRAPSWRR